MKNSNKLLILLIASLFSIPLLMVMGFKNAIKENRYIVMSGNDFEAMPLRKTGAFKVVKFSGYTGQESLMCNIKQGDEVGYKFISASKNDDGSLDTSRIRISGDTLFITYGAKDGVSDGSKTKVPRYFENQIELTIPAEVTIIGESIKVSIDKTIRENSKLNFILSNKSVLDVLSNPPGRASQNVGDSLLVDSLVPKTVFPAIVIDAKDSEVNFNNYPLIKELSLHLTGQSILNIPIGVSVENVNGFISKESSINATAGEAKKFLHLIKD